MAGKYLLIRQLVRIRCWAFKADHIWTYLCINFDRLSVEFPVVVSVSMLSPNAGILLFRMCLWAKIDLCSLEIISRSISSLDSNSLCRPGSTWLTRSSVKVSVVAVAISESLLVQLTASADAVALYTISHDDAITNRFFALPSKLKALYACSFGLLTSSLFHRHQLCLIDCSAYGLFPWHYFDFVCIVQIVRLRFHSVSGSCLMKIRLFELWHSIQINSKWTWLEWRSQRSPTLKFKVACPLFHLSPIFTTNWGIYLLMTTFSKPRTKCSSVRLQGNRPH